MLIQANARFLPIASNTVQCCVTSPPYWGLRDYGVSGQLGLEPTPDAYVASMVEVFREVWRVLRDDGTLWLNLGDSYTGAANSGGRNMNDGGPAVRVAGMATKTGDGLKPKDLVGIPWRVAFALQADGWYLRSDIIWSKPNPMPESVTDRPTKAHEYLFLLTKNERYYWDAKAVSETAIGPAGGNVRPNKSFVHDPVKHRTKAGLAACQERARQAGGFDTRNVRTVWHIPTQPYREAHFAVMPERLVEPCVKAGSKPGDLVLDPFAGSGTVGVVAAKLNRRFIGTELNTAYIVLARRRMSDVQRLMTF